MTVRSSEFGQVDGHDVYQFSITNPKGFSLSVLNFGGILKSFEVPNLNGASNLDKPSNSNEVPNSNEERTNIVLGLDHIADYQKDPFYLGAIMGRVSNRIENARFVLDGKTYRLSKNHGRHHLHGGHEGLSKKLWYANADSANDAVQMTYRSVDGEDGYPGNVDFTVEYKLKDNQLILTMSGIPDRPTPIALAQHFYFNLNGNGNAFMNSTSPLKKNDILSQSVLQHRFQIDADRYLEVDKELIPTGKVLPVKETIYDFSRERNLLNRENKPIDCDVHLMFNEGRNSKNIVAQAVGDRTNIKLSLISDQEGMQFYNSDKMKNKYAAFCMEPQSRPNSVNRADFPSVIFTPDRHYRQQLIFEVVS